MNGTIHFDNIEQLAVFLKELTGSTAVFTVTFHGGSPVLTFTGGF